MRDSCVAIDPRHPHVRNHQVIGDAWIERIRARKRNSTVLECLYAIPCNLHDGPHFLQQKINSPPMVIGFHASASMQGKHVTRLRGIIWQLRSFRAAERGVRESPHVHLAGPRSIKGAGISPRCGPSIVLGNAHAQKKATAPSPEDFHSDARFRKPLVRDEADSPPQDRCPWQDR